MAADLEITFEEPKSNHPVRVLHLGGWLDQTGEERLVEAARAALEQGGRFLVLDLSRLEMLTSAGVRALQRIYKLMTPVPGDEAPRRLKLCNAPPNVYAVLRMTGLLQMIPNYESAQTAIDSFGV